MSNELFQVNTRYKTYIEGLGWSEESMNGVSSGTEGQNLRIEAFMLSLDVPEGVELHAMCRAHVAVLGWLDPRSDGEECGTTGQGLALQAIQIQLYGADSANYDVFFQVHVRNKGWMNWQCNGELAGTVGLDLQAEGIRVMVFKKGVSLKTDDVEGFVEYIAPPAKDPEYDTTMASPHFSKKEISCDCTPWKENFGWCDGYPEVELMQQNLPAILDVLEKIRNHFGAPVIITSMIRCFRCNDYWNGVPGSYHTEWKAADIVVPGYSPYEVAVAANELTGWGARYYRYDGFTHIEPPGCGVVMQQ